MQWEGLARLDEKAGEYVSFFDTYGPCLQDFAAPILPLANLDLNERGLHGKGRLPFMERINVSFYK